MTTPTQAQIEAAMRVYSNTYQYPFDMRAVMRAVLTAAAEVGEAYVCALQTGKSGRRCFGYEMEAAAIERCAQVAESYDGYISAPNPKTLAAAIRALKERP